jgi:hypothetical protein
MDNRGCYFCGKHWSIGNLGDVKKLASKLLTGLESGLVRHWPR